MNPNLQRYIDAASGLGNLTAARAEQVIKQLKSKEGLPGQVSELADELMERQRKNREAIGALVQAESIRAVRGMGLATAKDVDRLRQRVADLEARVSAAEALAASAGAANGGRATPSTGTRAAKKSSKNAAKKTAKKSAVNKTAADRTATKAPAKKAVGKKSAVKKSAAKKSSAKRTSAKTPAKKTSGKQAPAKKSARRAT